MAKLKRPPEPMAAARLRGVIQYTNDRGLLVAKKWPRRRPGPGTSGEQDQRNEFKHLVSSVNNMSALDKATAINMASGSGYTWRDVLSRAAVGAFIQWDQVQIMGIQRDLDGITPVVGSLLLRTVDGWVGLPPGLAQQILTISPSTTLPEWDNPSPSGIDELTGDVSAGPGTGSQVASLVTTGVLAGSYMLTNLTVDAKGRITAAANGTAPAYINQLNGDVTAGPGSGNQTATLAASGVTPGSYTNANITIDAKGRITVAANGSPGSGITQLTGDVTAGPGTGSQTSTLAASGVTPGSYTTADITVDAKGRLTAAASGTGTGVPLPRLPLRSGRWYAPNFGGLTTTTGAAASTLYAMPFYIPGPVTITQVASARTSSAPGAQAELGIYQDSNGYPGALIADCGTVSHATGGTGIITGLSISLTRGWYWGVVGTNATVGYSLVAPAGDNYCGQQVGSTNVLSGTQAGQPGYSGPWTFSAGGLPNPFPAGFAAAANITFLSVRP